MLDSLIHMKMERFLDESRQSSILEDEVYLKDIRDETELEQRYMQLDIPKTQKFLIDDYIACVKTAGIRYSELSYVAGIKDAVKMLVEEGLLEDQECGVLGDMRQKFNL